MKSIAISVLLCATAFLATPTSADDAGECKKTTGDASIAACTRAIESGLWQGADLSWAYSYRGLAKRAIGDLDGSIADYDRAIELDPRYVQAYNNRALARRSRGDAAWAEDFKRARELAPTSPATSPRGDDAVECEKASGDTRIAACTRVIDSGRFRDYKYTIALASIYYNRGLAKKDIGDLDGAIDDFNSAIQLGPKYPDIYINRGNAKQKKGNLDGAIDDYNHAIKSSPRHALAYYNRGLAKQNKGDLDGAIADYSRTIELDPRFALAYFNRGNAEMAIGDLDIILSDDLGAVTANYDRAIADYNRAIELNPQHAKAYYNRGIARKAKGDAAGAGRDFKRARELDPKLTPPTGTTTPLTPAADDEQNCVKGAGAARVAACTRAIKSGRWQGGDLSWAYYNRGNANANRGDLDGAMADYSRAIELDPQHADAFNNRGSIKANKGNHDGAMADFNRAIKLDPRHNAAYYRRGFLLFNTGKFDLAAADFARSQELNPDTSIALWLYIAKTRSGQNALEALKDQTTSASPTQWPGPIAMLFLGKASPESVEKSAVHLDAKTHKEQLCDTSLYVGEWHLLQGRRAQAITALRTARDRCAKNGIEYNITVHELKRLEAP